MREIVHLQAGQCGNQIGAKVSPTNNPANVKQWLPLNWNNGNM